MLVIVGRFGEDVQKVLFVPCHCPFAGCLLDKRLVSQMTFCGCLSLQLHSCAFLSMTIAVITVIVIRQGSTQTSQIRYAINRLSVVEYYLLELVRLSKHLYVGITDSEYR